MSVSKSFMCNLPSNNFPDDPKDPNKHLYDVDDETTYVIYLGFSNLRCFLKGCFLSVITLSDWYHDTALNLESKVFLFDSQQKPSFWLKNDFSDAWFAGGPEPVPDSGLINSAGRFAGGPPVKRSRINVKQGKRYRLRFVSVSAEGGNISPYPNRKV